MANNDFGRGPNIRFKFRVELKDYFHTLELYDSKGREIFDIDSAAEAAEEQYGSGWASVFNGQEAATREDYQLNG